MGLTPACNRILFRFAANIILVFILTGSTHASELILSSENLNETLKQMQRIRQDMENAEPAARADGMYKLGIMANDLAAILSEEVALYDSQQGGLIQLGLDRTGELGMDLIWIPEKKRFIYDGKFFGEYLQLAPDGPHAADSAFFSLQTEFVRVVADDPAAVQLAADHKNDYLKKYPEHENAAEVSLLLAIDYRDLWRLNRSDADKEARYRKMTLNQFRQVIDQYPGAKQARVAQGLQVRFESELQNSADAAGQ